MTQKKVTITDIAKAAGVSKTTISRYLNGRFDLMSPETRRRIESVIDVSGYQPSTIARSLKKSARCCWVLWFQTNPLRSPRRFCLAWATRCATRNMCPCL